MKSFRFDAKKTTIRIDATAQHIKNNQSQSIKKESTYINAKQTEIDLNSDQINKKQSESMRS